MTRITKEKLAVEDDSVFVYRIAPPAAGTRRGVVFVPPLIGGSGLQQYGYFKPLNQAGYELVSFDYRGHGKSEGSFCIRNTIADTLAVAATLEHDYAELDCYGVGDCYGAIPLVAAANAHPGVFTALALFNPMPSLQYLAGPGMLAANYFAPGGRPRLRNPFDWKGVLAATNDLLFPFVDKSRDHFGILDYDRARPVRSIWEYFTLRPWRDVPELQVPTTVVYGKQDAVLGLDEPEKEERYRASFRRVVPHARFRALGEVDHYWTETKHVANEEALAFFRQLGPRRGRPESPPQRSHDVLTPSWSR